MSKPRVRLETSLELLLRRRDPSRAAVLATVAATAGSTYRKAGARMLIHEDGSHLGLLSGGCLEGDLAGHADRVLAEATPRTVEYDLRGPDDALFGLGAGCEGAMRILLEPAGPGSRASRALAHAGVALERGEPAVLVVVHEGPASVLGTHAAADAATLSGDAALGATIGRAAQAGESIAHDDRTSGLRAYVQCLAPPPRIVVCGAGDDARPVASMLVDLGWTTFVVDHRSRYADPARFPGAVVRCADAEAMANTVDLERCDAAIVMSHHLTADAAYLSALSRAHRPGFVGLLGPRARRDRLLGGAQGDAVRAGLGNRLRGPVGLDLGGCTPEGIALSIVAELHAWLAGRVGAPVQALTG